jgi:hypothetical protein
MLACSPPDGTSADPQNRAPRDVEVVIPEAGISITIDDHALQHGVCRYHDRGSGTWLKPSDVKWADVHRFWAAKNDSAHSSRGKKPQQARHKEKTESAVEILGANQEGPTLVFALRVPGRSEIVKMPSAEVRKKYPTILVKYYEQHIHFI